MTPELLVTTLAAVLALVLRAAFRRTRRPGCGGGISAPEQKEQARCKRDGSDQPGQHAPHRTFGVV